MLGVMVTAPDLVGSCSAEVDGRCPSSRCSPGSVCTSPSPLNSSVLQAANRTELMLRYAIITVIADVVAFGVGAHWGILGVAVAYAIATTLIAPLYFQLPRRASGSTAAASCER